MYVLVYIYIYMYVYMCWNERKTFFFNAQKVGMLLQKSTNTRGVGISSMRISIYLLTTTPSSHTHRFHPLATPTSCSPHPLATPIHSTHSTIVIHTLNFAQVFAQVKSMDDNCGEWVECMGVASGWNLWVWLLDVVVRRYIDFLILLIPTSLVSVLFCSSIPTFLFI